MSHPTKKWEVFPGKNKFCLDGRIIMGPDVTVFYINVFLIVGTTLLFLIFDCPFLAIRVSIFIPVVTIIMFFFVMAALFRTSFTDPGIIPRATNDEAMYIEKQIKITTCGDTTAERPPPRTKEVTIKGQSVKLKYCFTCKIFRPPRASHCSLCDNCVDHFDHHCPWVGNCVGRRNYRYFYLFTVTLSFYIAFVFICTCTHLYLLSENKVTMVEAVADSPASVIVILITFFSCWSVFGLAGFHTYLAASNQTTNEDIKGSFSNKRGGASRNPYSFGNSCSNCCYVLCGPFPSSLIDSEGFVTPDLVEKKFVHERQPSKIGSPVYVTPNTCNNLHYQLNGVKSYSTIGGGPATKSYSTVISNQQAARQHFASRKSSPSLSNDKFDDISLKSRTAIYETIDERSPPRSTYTRPSHPSAIDVSKIDLDLDGIDGSSVAQAAGAATIAINNKSSLSLVPLSASKLQLLQDTTMIQSALDLDSLEESTSSVGVNSQAGLIKGKHSL